VESQGLELATFCYYSECWDKSWLAFYDYFNKIGILKNAAFDKYIKLSEGNMFMWVALQGYAIVSKPPIVILRDEQNRMHNIDNYAIQFKDGYGQHYIHGVFFSPELFDKFFVKKDFNSKDILSLRNAEQKAVLLQEYGFESVIKDIDAKVIDVYNGKSQITGKPVKYELIDFKIDELECRAVKVEDHTMHKIVTLGVPRLKETEDCLGAIAWTFNLTKEEYKLKIES